MMQATRTHEASMGKRTTWNAGTLYRREASNQIDGARKTCGIEKEHTKSAGHGAMRPRPSVGQRSYYSTVVLGAGSTQLAKTCVTDVGRRAGGCKLVHSTIWHTGNSHRTEAGASRVVTVYAHIYERVRKQNVICIYIVCVRMYAYVYRESEEGR